MITDGLRFGWNSINCFLRPQALLCDKIAPGYGLLFLFLTSAYRTFGFDGYFRDADKQHFEFAATVACGVMGLQFDVKRLGDGDRIMESLERCLARDYPVIVPANIRYLEYFAFYNQVDQAHYFIVTGVDRARKTVAILDNLHLTPDNTSMEYGLTEMSEHLFASLARRYMQTHIKRSGPTSESEAYWLLQIRPEADFARQDDTALAERIISEYRGYLRDLDRGRRHVFLDDRYLGRLENLCAAGLRNELKTLIRAYLADCNLAAVHLRIMIHVLGHIHRDAATELTDHVERYLEAASARRMQVLVKCLMPEGMSSTEWQDVSSELAALAFRLRSAVADRITNVHVHV